MDWEIRYINDFPLQIDSLADMIMTPASLSHILIMMILRWCLTLYCYTSLNGSRLISWHQI